MSNNPPASGGLIQPPPVKVERVTKSDLGSYWLILVIVVLLVGGIIAYFSMTSFRSSVNTVTEDISITFVAVEKIVLKLLAEVYLLILQLVALVTKVVLDTYTLLSSIFTSLTSNIVDLTNAIVTLITAFADDFAGAFTNVINAITAYFDGALNDVYKSLANFPSNATKSGGCFNP